MEVRGILVGVGEVGWGMVEGEEEAEAELVGVVEERVDCFGGPVLEPVCGIRFVSVRR